MEDDIIGKMTEKRIIEIIVTLFLISIYSQISNNLQANNLW